VRQQPLEVGRADLQILRGYELPEYGGEAGGEDQRNVFFPAAGLG
jgi:hypothetical protein